MRRLTTGEVVPFTAKEFWKENYAVKGGKDKSIAPNAMWAKRPYGQIAKCAEAQALRKAFPEIGSQPAAEEMEGKTMQPDMEQHTPEPATIVLPEERRTELLLAFEECASMANLQTLWQSMTAPERKVMADMKDLAKQRIMEDV